MIGLNLLFKEECTLLFLHDTFEQWLSIILSDVLILILIIRLTSLPLRWVSPAGIHLWLMVRVLSVRFLVNIVQCSVLSVVLA
jgi:hypothetical protein